MLVGHQKSSNKKIDDQLDSKLVKIILAGAMGAKGAQQPKIIGNIEQY